MFNYKEMGFFLIIFKPPRIEKQQKVNKYLPHWILERKLISQKS